MLFSFRQWLLGMLSAPEFIRGNEDIFSRLSYNTPVLCLMRGSHLLTLFSSSSSSQTVICWSDLAQTVHCVEKASVYMNVFLTVVAFITAKLNLLYVSYRSVTHSFFKSCIAFSKPFSNMLINCFIHLLFNDSFSNTHSLCCLLPAPPIPLSCVCISLYITVCHSYSPDCSTPVPPPRFHLQSSTLSSACSFSSSLQYVLS